MSAEKKRAEGLDKKKAALQGENDELVRQLEEVRSKVVQVSEELAGMTTAKEGLEYELKHARSEVGRMEEELAAERQEREKEALNRKELEKQAERRGEETETLRVELSDIRKRLEATEKALEAAGSGATSTGQGASRQQQQQQQQSMLAIRDRTLDYLPASVRHKREVSLSALKARLGSQVTNGHGHTSHASGATPANPTKGARLDNTSVREQWGDEIMFCCPACEGDLINL